MGHDYGWEWSGSDRLSEPYHRWDNTPDIACGSSVWGWEGLGPGKYPCAKKFCQNSDFNGLDYMLLFNLYSLVKGDYIGLFFNSYYEEALATSYPHGSAGAAPSRLMLNYLEYLRLINKINPDARVTFRGGKTIELKPGFEAKYGSQTLLHIKDYNCDNRLDGVDDRYHFAEFTNGAGNVITHIDYTPYMGTPSDVPARIGEEEEEGYTDEQADSIMNSPALKAYEASLIDTIYASGDEMAIAALERMRGSNPAARARAAARHLEILPTFTADLHPNPTTGFFTLHTSAPATYEVTVFTTLGVKISEHTFTGTEAHLSLPPSTPPGNYTVFVQGPTTRTALKLTVVP